MYSTDISNYSQAYTNNTKDRYQQKRYDEIVIHMKKHLYKKIGFKKNEVIAFVPISGFDGVNSVKGIYSLIPWYYANENKDKYRYGKNLQSLSLLDALNAVNCPARKVNQSLRMPIQNVYQTYTQTIITGRILSGTIRTGTKIAFSNGFISECREIIFFRNL